MAADHPLRAIRTIVKDALSGLSGELEALYSHLGRSSIPPERLLRALLLQALYSIRSERLLMEQLNYRLLYGWFVGLGIDELVWRPTAFTTNHERLLEGEVAAKFLAAVLDHPRVRQLLSREHFTVDGALVEAWAALKCFRPKDGRDDPPGGGRNASRDFHGARRSNDSYASATDPDAALLRQPTARRPDCASWAIARSGWERAPTPLGPVLAVTPDGRRVVSGSWDHALGSGAWRRAPCWRPWRPWRAGHGARGDAGRGASGRGLEGPDAPGLGPATSSLCSREIRVSCCAITTAGRFVVAGDGAGQTHLLEILL